MVKITAIILTVFTILLFLYVFFNQRRLIYFPDKSKPSINLYNASKFKEISFQTSDGLKLVGWYKKPEKQKITLLYLHGNAGHFAHRLPLVQSYIARGYGIFLFSYRGYGGNPGKPHEKGLYLDAKAALKALKKQGQDCIVLFGESIGSAVAIELATQSKVQGLILKSPFNSLNRLARYHYPMLSFIKTWDKFDSLKKIKNISDIPTLFLHGEEDTIVPLAFTKELYNKANGPKKLIIYPHKGHNDLASKQLYQDVLEFLQRQITCP